MQIKYGDIWKTPLNNIVIPVNQVAVMGTGLAKQAAVRYPEMVSNYKALCYRNEILPNRPMIHYTSGKDLILMPTKNHWRNPAILEYIEIGIAWIASLDQPVALPALGCGAGTLDWEDQVRPIMESHLSTTNCIVYLLETD